MQPAVVMRRRLLAAFASTTLLLVSSAALAAESFRGNTRSHVFHQSSCRYYSCTNCTAKFASAREAVENGYRPCGICEPGGASRETTANSAAYVGNTNSHKFIELHAGTRGVPTALRSSILEMKQSRRATPPVVVVNPEAQGPANFA